MNLAPLARQWLGTPYVHQSSCRKAGTDCLGLITGTLREAGYPLPDDIPEYSADWGEHDGVEHMLNAASDRFEKVDAGDVVEGDILVFRWQAGSIAKHAGIATGPNSFIHAYERGGVVEVTLNRHWRRRIAGCFRPAFQTPHGPSA